MVINFNLFEKEIYNTDSDKNYVKYFRSTIDDYNIVDYITKLNISNPIVKKWTKKLNKLKDKEQIDYATDSEYMYYFQKELLENYPYKFYELFIKDELERFKLDQQSDNVDLNKIFLYDVHPKLKNKKIKNLINIYNKTKKYNL